MNIYFAESPYVNPAESGLVASLETFMPQYGGVLITEPRPDIPLADASPVIRRADSLVVNFEEPNELLRDKVLFAHSIGKSVLVGLNINLDPVEILGDMSKPPYRELEKRSSRAYYVYGEDSKIHSVKHQRLGLFEDQIKIWLAGIEIKRRMAKKLPPSAEPLTIKLADGTLAGPETDERLAKFDKALREHGLPGLDD